MAHKKAGGSSRNGRDSAGKRLGMKAFGGEHVIPATSLHVSAAPPGIPALTSAWARITPCSPRSKAMSNSAPKPTAAPSSRLFRWRPRLEKAEMLAFLLISGLAEVAASTPLPTYRP